ncbi:MAG: hypothetical protein H8J66_05220 [Nitrospira sp.]|nr:hypothetical protein [Nitrospira sp.]
MAEHEFEKLLGGFAADTLTPEERRQLFAAAMQDQQLFNALADEQALKELLTDPAVRRRLLQALHNTTPTPADGSASWLNWFRRPANLALAGGLATAVFAAVLGTRIYQDSLKQETHSVAMEETKPAVPTLPASQPAPSQPAEPKSKSKETGAPAPTVAKKDGLTDKPATSERVAPSLLPQYKDVDSIRKDAPERTSQEKDPKQAEASSAARGKTSAGVTQPANQQSAAGSSATAPEPKILQTPVKSSAPVANARPVSARALFYGEGTSVETGKMSRDNERAMNAPAESETPSNPFKRKLEGLSQLSKAAGPSTASTPLGLRYSFVVQNSDGQEQEIDAAAASRNSTPVQLTIETNQDGYIQVWRNVESANTQLLLPQKTSGHISQKIQTGQRQRLVLPAESGTVIVRLSRIPFGPISRQEAALLNRVAPNQLRESVAASSPTDSQEQATYVVSQDPSPTAQITVDILLTRRQ